MGWMPTNHGWVGISALKPWGLGGLKPNTCPGLGDNWLFVWNCKCFQISVRKNITALVKSSLCCAGGRPAGTTQGCGGQPGTDQCGQEESRPQLLQVLPGHEMIPGVSDPKTRSLKSLCHSGISNQKNFVLGTAGTSEKPIPLDNRENKKGYTFISRGLLTTLFWIIHK